MSTTIPTAPQVSVSAQRAFASYIADAVIGDAVGTTDGDRCVGEPASARYFLGALAPMDLDLSAGRHRRGRETSNSAGFDFEVSDPHGSVSVSVGFSLYYRVFPTLEEQLAVSGAEARGASESFPIAVVFKRIEIPVTIVVVDLDADPLTRHGQDVFDAAIGAARETITGDPWTFRRNDPRRSHAERVPGTELTDGGRFAAWCDAVTGAAVIPDWRLYVSVKSRTTAAGTTRVALRLVNDSVDPSVEVPGRRRGTTARRHDDDRDHFVFRISVSVKPLVGRLQQIRMNLGPDEYRYDADLPAYASNCGVEAVTEGRQIVELHSVWAPRWKTHRIASRPDPATAFRRLEEEPIAVLDELGDRLDRYALSPGWSTEYLPPEQVAAKARDLDAYRAEVQRFRAGVQWLRNDARLLLAFRLMNRTMTRVGEMSGRPYSGWYLFQLVFIVSQLPSLAWREHPPRSFDQVDGQEDPTMIASVLWFPTGGGKTEAYLGLAACAMFYDRARGKRSGVTAWCRLPLRLLTLQATQRQVAFVAAADEVRIAATHEIVSVGGHAGDPFRVGVFMGDSNTPNSISRDAATVGLLRDNPERRNRYRVVDKCPYCRARAVSIVPPDPTTLRLVHECGDCGREIPVVITDNEIYRLLPAFVVGTIDKLASIGLTDKFGALLGDVDGMCDLHGYGRGGKCVERRAPEHPKNVWRPLTRPLYDASPSLEIIDELHMLREEFGVFDGHYESGLANIQRELSSRARADGRGVRMKIVATTATIKGEDRQCDHLFGLRSVALPLPGPTLEESFYWTRQDDPLREFIGVLPQRTTSEQALVRILLAFHKSVRRVDSEGRDADARFCDIDPTEFEVLRDLYRVSLTYVTSLLDFGKVSRSVETQVNHSLRGLGLAEVKAARVSADAAKDGIGAIRAIIDDLEKPAGESEYEAVLATAMVAHGVDIERLNVMIFNGMPKSMAEYIQASSRVGRKNLGVVFTLFNPIRERDRSHFRYHGKFHEYLDRMVEPVAINRWSRYAARRTFPGVLMAEILQNGNRVWWDTGHAPRHLHDLAQAQEASRPLDKGGIPDLQQPTLTASMESAFLAQRPEAFELREELADWTRTALGTVRAAGAAGVVRGNGRSQYRATGDHLGLAYQPMMSLRDVEEDVPIVVLDRRAR